MKKVEDGIKRASCSECPNSFELVPPADGSYCIPREKPKTNDFLKRVYECDEEHHRNTIYWEKIEEAIFVSGTEIIEPEPTEYSRQQFGLGRYRTL